MIDEMSLGRARWSSTGLSPPQWSEQATRGDLLLGQRDVFAAISVADRDYAVERPGES
jgi:hypothetical protein